LNDLKNFGILSYIKPKFYKKNNKNSQF
jgi:hypothetical protein